MMPLPYTKYYDLSKEEMQLLSEIWKDMVHFLSKCEPWFAFLGVLASKKVSRGQLFFSK